MPTLPYNQFTLKYILRYKTLSFSYNYVHNFTFLFPGVHWIKLLLEKKTLLKYENSGGKHEFTIDFTIGRKQRLK